MHKMEGLMGRRVGKEVIRSPLLRGKGRGPINWATLSSFGGDGEGPCDLDFLGGWVGMENPSCVMDRGTASLVLIRKWLSDH